MRTQNGPCVACLSHLVTHTHTHTQTGPAERSIILQSAYSTLLSHSLLDTLARTFLHKTLTFTSLQEAIRCFLLISLLIKFISFFFLFLFNDLKGHNGIKPLVFVLHRKKYPAVKNGDWEIATERYCGTAGNKNQVCNEFE